MANKAKRERDIKLNFYVMQRELDLIKEKMELAKVKNMSAYLRKMACDGYILNVNFSEFKNLFSNIGSISNNINQIAKRVNSTNNIYQGNVSELKQKQEEIWQLLKSMQNSLIKIK